MNAGRSPATLRAEVAHCRREWALHWHARRHPDPATRTAGREERRFWAGSLVRARQMLCTELRIKGTT